MSSFGRRALIQGAGAALAGRAVGLDGSRPAAAAADDVFGWGVASFDPGPDSVLLWTRIAPSAAGGTTTLSWVVASDAALGDVVASGTVEVGPDTGWCGRVDATGLGAAGVWWYAFTAPDGTRSPVGRTRTFPAATSERLRVAAVSCARFADGGFAVYRALAEREMDLVVQLGDYVYEDGGEAVRAHVPPHELLTLDDYRTRYEQHRADPDLQALRARHPVVAIWDDHEIAGNAWRGGAPGHDEATDGPWAARVEAALRAHDEWLPGRTEWTDDRRLRAWRSASLGPLAELIVLDTRIWGRDRQAQSAAELLAGGARSMLGPDQQAFVSERLAAPDRAPWALVANQVMLHPLRVPVPSEAIGRRIEDEGFLVVDGEALNPDQWDGYPAARDELVAAMGGQGGVVVLTGDVHSSWAWEGPATDSGAPACVELVAPSVSSGSFATRLPLPAAVAERAITALDDDLSFIEIESHGYLLVDLTPDRVQGEWWYVEPADAGSQRFGAARSAPRQVPMHLQEETEPTSDPPAPAEPPGTTTTVAPVPAEPTAENDLPLGLIGGGASAVVAAAAAALVAIRRRRS